MKHQSDKFVFNSFSTINHNLYGIEYAQPRNLQVVFRLLPPPPGNCLLFSWWDSNIQLYVSLQFNSGFIDNSIQLG